MFELPLIDISIVTYNSARWLEKFFKSLKQQNYPTNKLNIYIRDNGSTDNTLELCQAIAIQYLNDFNSFEISQGKNKGFGYGHNRNLEKANSDYFLVTNVDLEFELSSIREVVTTALADPENIASWEFRQKPYEHPKFYNPVTLETCWSSSACILFRRAALEKIGGYEERIFMYGEDVELSYRLRDNGYKLKYCPKAVCWHYTYENIGQVKPLQFFGSTLANVYIRMRYGSWRSAAGGVLLYLQLMAEHSGFIAILNNWRRVLKKLIGVLLHPRCYGQKIQKIAKAFKKSNLRIAFDVCERNQLKRKRLQVLRELFKNGCKILFHAPYFLLTRKKTKNYFPFQAWDYELIRGGAFYCHKKSLAEESPLVSIIIRTYKGRLNNLREAVASILNQTYSNIELIIIEDGSSEAENYINEIRIRNILSKIIYYSIPKSGRCVAGNKGLELANGEYIGFLDDDDFFFSEHIEVLVSELISNKNIDGAYSLALQIGLDAPLAEVSGGCEVNSHLFYRQKFSRAVLWHHNFIPIQSILFKKELYKQYGGFDTSLEYLEDWNLWVNR